MFGITRDPHYQGPGFVVWFLSRTAWLWVIGTLVYLYGTDTVLGWAGVAYSYGTAPQDHGIVWMLVWWALAIIGCTLAGFGLFDD